MSEGGTTYPFFEHTVYDVLPTSFLILIPIVGSIAR